MDGVNDDSQRRSKGDVPVGLPRFILPILRTVENGQHANLRKRVINFIDEQIRCAANHPLMSPVTAPGRAIRGKLRSRSADARISAATRMAADGLSSEM
ncbi:MAG: hypothetical protein Q7T81_01725 [Pseudolabrys sp.]|nr:hypothetical protein [Pseudolabrys sp.]